MLNLLMLINCAGKTEVLILIFRFGFLNAAEKTNFNAIRHMTEVLGKFFNARKKFRQKREIRKNPIHKVNGIYGADNRIRTGDLVLTKDVLYLLSHISNYTGVGSLLPNTGYYIRLFIKLQAFFIFILYLPLFAGRSGYYKNGFPAIIIREMAI